jgi:hypothetical protein
VLHRDLHEREPQLPALQQASADILQQAVYLRQCRGLCKVVFDARRKSPAKRERRRRIRQQSRAPVRKRHLASCTRFEQGRPCIASGTRWEAGFGAATS